MNKFYSEIISFDMEDVNMSSIDISNKIINLNKRLKAKEFKKRRLGCMKM